LIFDHLCAYLLLCTCPFHNCKSCELQFLGLQPSIELKASSIFWFLSCEINESKWQNLFFPCEILRGINLNFQCTSSLMILMMMLFFVVVCFFWDAIRLHEQGTSLFSLIDLGAVIGWLSSTPVFFFSCVLSFSLSVVYQAVAEWRKDSGAEGDDALWGLCKYSEKSSEKDPRFFTFTTPLQFFHVTSINGNFQVQIIFSRWPYCFFQYLSSKIYCFSYNVLKIWW
jgi:hypothetical protein